MRVSSDKNDPGYAAYAQLRARGKTVTVFLDGVEVDKCDMADDEEGMVSYAVLTDDGKLQLDPCNPDQILTERAHGVVEIVVS
ncbi:hypothetical protein [Stappia sp.]|uniref:hypothetical protein n=1 Tax=Stappia sp. TaxID=1870903 RepID=UPI003C7B9F52